MIRLGPLAQRVVVALLMAGSALGLGSCGGGGAGGFVASTGGGTGGTGIVLGAITGFGSVIVKGVEFDVSGATFDDNGVDRGSDDSFLRVGMVVTVTGTIDAGGVTGTATTIAFDNDLAGPVSNRDPVTNSFQVLGQTVKVAADTVFDGISFAALADGDLVRVSGFRDVDGNLVASWVGFAGASLTTVEVQGAVTGTGAGSFQLGTLTVNFNGAIPAVGSFVEAKGTFDSLSDVLTATSVEVKSAGVGAMEGDEVEIEGLVDHFTSATDFTVGGQAVTTDAGTQFKNGTAGDLALNRKVEVKGKVNASGVLVADSVEYQSESTWRIEAAVSTLDAAAGTLQFFNGSGEAVTVATTAATSFGDDSNQDKRPFAFADIKPGDFLEVRGTGDAASGLTATQVLRQDPDSDCRIKAPVDDLNPTSTSFKLLGVTADTDMTTQFLGADEMPMQQADFYSSLQTGDTVEARWANCTLSVPPKEVERN